MRLPRLGIEPLQRRTTSSQQLLFQGRLAATGAIVLPPFNRRQ